MQRLLAERPADRPTAHIARSLPWLANAAGTAPSGDTADAVARAEPSGGDSPIPDAVRALPRLLQEVEALGSGAPAAYAAAHSAASLKLVLADDVARANSDARVPWPSALE